MSIRFVGVDPKSRSWHFSAFWFNISITDQHLTYYLLSLLVSLFFSLIRKIPEEITNNILFSSFFIYQHYFPERVRESAIMYILIRETNSRTDKL
uniref:Uncharacterized protein n=1 Tax=Meloidogyne enterolobii TaxID=390850 RepID=A0A6V7UZD1_MELEN|nr:unnamed protein product [Meloidogyne enterolobii]